MDIRIKGLDDVTGNLDSFSQNVQVELKEALDISLRDVQEYAREHHRFITRTGEAERSIETAASYGTYFKGVVRYNARGNRLFAYRNGQACNRVAFKTGRSALSKAIN